MAVDRVHEVLPIRTAASASDCHGEATTAQVDATVRRAKSKGLEVHTIGDTRSCTSLNRLPVPAAISGRFTAAEAAGADKANVRAKGRADARHPCVGELSHCPPGP